MENEIKIIISADIENASKSLENLGKQLTNTFGEFSKQAGKPIQVVDKHITNFGKSAKNATDQLQKNLRPVADIFQKSFDRMDVEPVGTFAQFLDEAKFSAKEFTKQMPGFEDLNDGNMWNKATGEIMSYQKAIGKAMINSRRFNMSLLSVMFAGMALDRVFGGLIRTQMELWGVTEMMSAAWTITLMPIMEIVTPVIYKLIEAFMNLSPEMQTFIGGLVFVGAALGKAMLIFGQFGLGLMGIKGLFPGLASAIAKSGGVVKALGAALTGLSATVLIVVGAIILVFVGMYLAFKENFLGMQKVVQFWLDAIKQGFNGLLTWFKGIMNILKGLFTGDVDLIIKGVKQVFSGLFDFLIAGFKMMGSVIVAVLIGALRIVTGVVQTVINLIGRIPELWGGKKAWDVNLIEKVSIPSFKQGGMMDHTGLAYLHAGEQIIPKNEVGKNVSFAPVITINANTNANADDISRTISEELNRQWSYRFNRGIY